MRVPGGGEENLWLAGGHGNVGDADVGTFIENARPVFAAVGGFVDAALIVGSVGVTKSADVDGARIGGIDEDAADLAGTFEADARPGCTGVVAAVDACA